MVAAIVGIFLNQAFAYIPPYWMIMSRVAENHGKGPYQLEQRIEFSHGAEPLIVNEKWIIEDEDHFRLEATGVGPLKDKLRLTYVYSGGRRHFVDTNGLKKSEKAPDDFFEPYFHFRRSKVIKSRLVAHKVVPASTLKSEAQRYSERNPRPPEEAFVRLGRSGGVVAYAIGEPTPVGSASQNPGLWIEQDQFHVRKIRFPSGTEISAEAFQKYSREAWFPGQLQILWSGQNLKVKVGRVLALNSGKEVKEMLNPNLLNFGNDPLVATQLPDDQFIRGFYQSVR